METLKSVFPPLAEELEKAGDDGGMTVEAASTGAPTLVYRGLYVHSKRDPEREAERLADGSGRAPGEDKSPVLILGFGLGYAASALAEKFPARPIIVVEKRPEILKKALEAKDQRKLLTRERLVFVLGGDGGSVTGALSLFSGSLQTGGGAGSGTPPLVLRNRALCGLDEEWYAGVEEKIRTWHSRANVNQATQKRFGKRWVRNLSKNLEAVRDRPGISRLEGLLSGRGIPVFLAAAGPTLDAAGPILGEIHKRCVTVAVDTSLRFFIRRGIEPDFVVSVDPQYWNFRHLDRAPAPKTRLVAESAVYPPVLRQRFGGVFLCGSFFPLGRFIEERVDPKGDLGTGGSVATSAWDFARLLGGQSLWIAGLDLSFPELKTHFRGALFEEKSHAESGRFSPAETRSHRALRDGQPFPAKRKNGGTVLTDKRLSLYAAWFENRFSLDMKNYCLSDEGLDLKGLEPKAPAELLALPDCREEIDKLLSETYTALERDFYPDEACAGEVRKTRHENYENARKTLLDGLGKLKTLALDTADSAGKAASRSRQGRLDERGREKALTALDAADKAILESEVKEIAGFLFPETEHWEAEIAAANTDPLVRHLEFSARFYRALAEAAALNLLKLQK